MALKHDHVGYGVMNMSDRGGTMVDINGKQVFIRPAAVLALAEFRDAFPENRYELVKVTAVD